MRVRNPFWPQEPRPLSEMHPWLRAENGSIVELLLQRELQAGQGLTDCIPLVWLPVWFKNFGELYLASLAPLWELRTAQLISGRVFLRPDLSWYTKPRPTFF